MSLVEIARFYSETEADLAAARLTAEGIESFIFDRSTFGLGAAIGVRLMVLAEDREAALHLLSEGSG